MDTKEYYDYYLSLHKNKNCRLLHFIGQVVTILFVIFIFRTNSWIFLPLVPFVIYPFAWSGHFLFEKNKPAAFKDPLKAKLSDWIMFKDIILGKIKIF